MQLDFYVGIFLSVIYKFIYGLTYLMTSCNACVRGYFIIRDKIRFMLNCKIYVRREVQTDFYIRLLLLLASIEQWNLYLNNKSMD